MRGNKSDMQCYGEPECERYRDSVEFIAQDQCDGFGCHKLYLVNNTFKGLFTHRNIEGKIGMRDNSAVDTHGLIVSTNGFRGNLTIEDNEIEGVY